MALLGRFLGLTCIPLIAGCQGPVVLATSTGATELESLTPVEVVVGSTSDAPSVRARERFAKEQLPAVRNMLARFSEVRPVHARLRIVFLDSSRTEHAALPEIYGDNYKAEARALLSRAAASVTPADVESLVSDVACRFPGIGKPPIFEGLNQVFALPGSELRAELIARLTALLDDSKRANEVSSVFGRTNATTFVSEGARCGLVMFGATPETGELTPRTDDTVLHEIGHFVDKATRVAVHDRGLAPTPILNEALGDIFSHAVSGRTCHQLSVGSSECNRTMDGPASPIDAASDAYKNGQGLRVAAWAHIRSEPFAAAAERILRARDFALGNSEAIDPHVLLRKTTAEERASLDRADIAVAREFVSQLAK
jgi:hypothetical protein